MHDPLTERVFQARSAGMMIREIARQFRISDQAVKRHLIQALRQKRLENPGEDDFPPPAGPPPAH